MPLSDTNPAVDTNASPRFIAASIANHAPPDAPALATSPVQPLSIAIIGAGIAGLTSAAALRHSGHQIEISAPRSSFANELGAAIHVGPNATRVLATLGYDPARLRGVQCDGIRLYNSDGEQTMQASAADTKARYQSVWYLAHRVDLHDELKQLALAPHKDAPSPVLHLSSLVSKIDAEHGVIELADGTRYEADLIIGADGIRSLARDLVFEAPKAYTTGSSCYRFIIDANEIQNDAACLSIQQGDNYCRIILSETKRVVIYPCRNGDLLNFVCIYADKVTEPVDDWNAEATVDGLVASFADFGEPVLNCLRKARNVKHWQMLQRPQIPSWVKGRVCLVGDAAHPMLPHQGQGGGQAIEDGASLGPLFAPGTTPDQVSEVLKLYQQVRYARASTIESLSRTQLAGRSSMNPQKVQQYIFGHDVMEYAKHARSSQLIA